jgi:ribonuclease BN (tRNA processing enzyme)
MFVSRYSGDTRPCLRLVEAGMGADVLIHEATFGEGMEADAMEKNHSLVSEAFMVAEAMKTKMLFLTHFSQRYPGADGSTKNNKESDVSHHIDSPVKLPSVPFLYAFDGMRWSSWMNTDFVRQSQALIESVVMNSSISGDETASTTT